jgi:carboxymethylenebutenolidase
LIRTTGAGSARKDRPEVKGAVTIAQHLLPVEQGELPLTIARGGGSGAAVVIVPSAFGIGADLEAQMDELAERASLVVALDVFFREDAGAVPYDDRARAMARLQGMNRGRTNRDLRAAIDWTRGEGSDRPLVVLGICLGGPFALMAAADGVADGVVTWHGTRMEMFLELAADMRCPMRHHFGATDPFVPPEAVEAVRKAFEGRADVRIVVHEGAGHGFSQRALPRAFDERAERAGMDAVRELIEELG